MIEGIEDVYEWDGDGPGSHMGWLLYGDVDCDDVDLFLADAAEQHPDGGDWNVIMDTYVRKVPRPDGFIFAYTNTPGRGARKCVRIERHWFWGYWCTNHPYEPASTGFPVSQVADPPWPKVLTRIVPAERRRERKSWRGEVLPQDGEPTVYLCRPCSTSFTERRADAVRAIMAERKAS